jgi:hypothetical protein
VPYIEVKNSSRVGTGDHVPRCDDERAVLQPLARDERGKPVALVVVGFCKRKCRSAADGIRDAYKALVAISLEGSDCPQGRGKTGSGTVKRKNMHKSKA